MVTDGRDRRWDEHRALRRRELVRQALRVIRTKGATVSMEDIAAQAGTSKAVIYRHFGDRSGLHRAVVESVHDYIMGRTNWDDDDDPAALISRIASAYIDAVDADLNIHQFVVTRPMAANPDGDPVANITIRMGTQLAERMAARLPDIDPDRVATWAHGAVGGIFAITEQWLATGRTRARDDLVADITALLPALTTGGTR